MGDLYLELENDKVAVIAQRTTGEPKRVATLYRMADGWHLKLSSLHTRHAWSGPFTTVEDAFDNFTGQVARSA